MNYHHTHGETERARLGCKYGSVPLVIIVQANNYKVHEQGANSGKDKEQGSGKLQAMIIGMI